MSQAKITNDGQGQVIHLPEEFQFEGDSVSIRRVGESIVLTPIPNPWEPFFKAAGDFSDDFMKTREQGQQRDRVVF